VDGEIGRVERELLGPPDVSLDPLGHPTLDSASFKGQPGVESAFQIDTHVHDELRATTASHVTYVT